MNKKIEMRRYEKKERKEGKTKTERMKERK